VGISHTTITKIVCDFKGCGKEFLMPDNPDENTPGTENTVSLVIARENRQVYFCGMKHLIAFALDYAKATPTTPATPTPAQMAAQIEKLKRMGVLVADAPQSRAHVAVEELEGIPPVVNLSLKGSQ